MTTELTLTLFFSLFKANCVPLPLRPVICSKLKLTWSWLSMHHTPAELMNARQFIFVAFILAVKNRTQKRERLAHPCGNYRANTQPAIFPTFFQEQSPPHYICHCRRMCLLSICPLTEVSVSQCPLAPRAPTCLLLVTAVTAPLGAFANRLHFFSSFTATHFDWQWVLLGGHVLLTCSLADALSGSEVTALAPISNYSSTRPNSVCQ